AVQHAAGRERAFLNGATRVTRRVDIGDVVGGDAQRFGVRHQRRKRTRHNSVEAHGLLRTHKFPLRDPQASCHIARGFFAAKPGCSGRFRRRTRQSLPSMAERSLSKRASDRAKQPRFQRKSCAENLVRCLLRTSRKIADDLVAQIPAMLFASSGAGLSSHPAAHASSSDFDAILAALTPDTQLPHLPAVASLSEYASLHYSALPSPKFENPAP